jgi:uncharacterized membrane protein YeiH
VTDATFRVPAAFEYVATFAWAMSGAVVGIRKRFDLTGVFVIALLSATGGGLLRDALFLQRTPAFLVSPISLPLIAGTTVLMALFSGPLTHVLKADTARKLVDLIDAIGTPAFAVVGMQLAMDKGIPVVGVIFIGLVNGSAGGLLRDVVVRDVPALLRPGQFVSLALAIVCILFMVLRLSYNVSPTDAAWFTVAGFVVIRLIAVRFNWQTRSVADGPLVGAIDESESDSTER